MSTDHSEILVYFWPGSPSASKVTSYLTLRHIPYTVVHQPITMPRPDLAALGICYRRIPLVSIGRDVYCDTLLILEALEAHYAAPSAYPPLSATTAEGKAMAYLLDKWASLAVFPQTAGCIPLDHPLMTDPKFVTDRSKLWGYDWDPAHRKALRPPALVAMRGFFEFLEHTLLADGRQWVLATDRPMLADLHAAWVFEWMLSLDGSFSDEIISETIFPKTYAWCKRYREAVDASAKETKVVEIDGEEALKRISAAARGTPSDVTVDRLDPLGLKYGQEVRVAPIDTGASSGQEGKLVGIDARQVVVETQAKNGEPVRVRFPRWNFEINPVTQ